MLGCNVLSAAAVFYIFFLSLKNAVERYSIFKVIKWAQLFQRKLENCGWKARMMPSCSAVTLQHICGSLTFNLQWLGIIFMSPPRSGKGHKGVPLSVRSYVNTYITLFNSVLVSAISPTVFHAWI